MRHITLITTGGTIEKVYDEASGRMENRGSIVRRMLEEPRLEETDVMTLPVMSKDSQDMTEDDRAKIVGAVRAALEIAGAPGDGVVVLHGTDTLALTGERIHERIPEPPVPIVLTGAMRPFEMKQSDALQNLTEAIFAAGLLPPGVYCVAHGRTLRFPGVQKDPVKGTFVLG